MRQKDILLYSNTSSKTAGSTSDTRLAGHFPLARLAASLPRPMGLWPGGVVPGGDFDPDEIAETYWQLYRQSRQEWTRELTSPARPPTRAVQRVRHPRRPEALRVIATSTPWPPFGERAMTPAGSATVAAKDLAGEFGIHFDSTPDVLNGQYDQSPSGSVVWPTSIR
jgi:hypothetical protein